jgi:hypothetical protein
MQSIFKISKSDLLRFPSLCADLTEISVNVKDSFDCATFLVGNRRLHPFLRKLQESSLSYEAYFNPEGSPSTDYFIRQSETN